MALADLLSTSANTRQADLDALVTKENLIKHLPQMRKIIAYWRMYPDRFVDFLCELNPESKFKFRFSQRLLLRAFARHKQVFATFTRGFSKSFTVVLYQMIASVLYPGTKQFSVSGMKNQSSEILKSKVFELCGLIPALSSEIIWDTRGTAASTHQTKDSVSYTFKNGSVLQNVVAGEQSRGLRFQGGVLEECVGIDQDILEQVLLPMLNVDRQVNGEIDPNETANKKRIFIDICDLIRQRILNNLSNCGDALT